MRSRSVLFNVYSHALFTRFFWGLLIGVLTKKLFIYLGAFIFQVLDSCVEYYGARLLVMTYCVMNCSPCGLSKVLSNRIFFLTSWVPRIRMRVIVSLLSVLFLSNFICGDRVFNMSKRSTLIFRLSFILSFFHSKFYIFAISLISNSFL